MKSARAEDMSLADILDMPYGERKPLLRRRRRKGIETARHQRRARIAVVKCNG